MSVGVIINPKAGKQSGQGLALAQKITGKPGVDVVILNRFEELYDALDRFAADKVDVVFISSGDGTVQAIQTYIIEKSGFETPPALCLLPHGTTNMTAADLGFSLKKIADQADFIIAAGSGKKPTDVRYRATVKVKNPADGQVRHGMFLGTGALWQGVVFCQVDVHKTGLKGNWATFVTLATALLKGAFIPANPHDETRIDRPFKMKISSGGKTIVDGEQLLYLATTLQKLILGTRPFWGGASGAMRSTIIGYPVPNVFTWAYTMMFGPEDRKVPKGSFSFCEDEVLIETDCPFVIDGEFFDPPSDAPLRVKTGPEFAYVCG